MWNPAAQVKRPTSAPMALAFGWMMDSREAARQLHRMGMLSRKDVKLFNRWIKAGCPPTQDGSRLDWITWATWVWAMTPGNFVDH